MPTVRRHPLRACPTALAVWLSLASPALSLDTDPGETLPLDRPRPELLEALLHDQPLGYFSLANTSAWRDAERAASEQVEPSEIEVVLDDVAWSGELLHVRVEPHVPVKRLYVTLPDVSRKRVKLALNHQSGLYEGEILVPFSYPRDELTVRVVARDQESKRLERDIVLPVLFDGC